MFSLKDAKPLIIYFCSGYLWLYGLQCFDAVGWVA